MPQDRPYRERERERAPRRQRPPKSDSRPSSGLRLIAVQSISCVVVLLVVLVMRLAAALLPNCGKASMNPS